MKRGCLTLAVLTVAVAVVVVLFGPRLLEGGLRLLYPQRYTELVEREAAEFDLEPNLVYAIIKTESGFDPQARSHADAMGLMQLTQETFDWILSLYPTEDGSGDIWDPGDNIHCGCALLRLLLDQYGTVEVALAAYNAGPWAMCPAGWKAATTPTTGRLSTPSPTRRRMPTCARSSGLIESMRSSIPKDW